VTLDLISGCLALNGVILIASYIGVRFVQPRWPHWWERWIIAPYPDDYEPKE
jgi:hypothetical protein